MECPTFYPSLEEFKDFEKCIEQIEEQSRGFGMAKVVPPKGWKARKKGYENITANVSHPVKQIVSGLAGLYQVILVSEPPLSFSKYKEYSKKRDPKHSLSLEELERRVFSN